MPDGDKFLSWPLAVFKGISTYFHDEDYVRLLGIDHLALDLRAPQGQEVYAPADAIVYKVYDGKGLKWLMLLHNHGYVTVYLHLSKILVNE